MTSLVEDITAGTPDKWVDAAGISDINIGDISYNIWNFPSYKYVYTDGNLLTNYPEASKKLHGVYGMSLSAEFAQFVTTLTTTSPTIDSVTSLGRNDEYTTWQISTEGGSYVFCASHQGIYDVSVMRNYSNVVLGAKDIVVTTDRHNYYIYDTKTKQINSYIGNSALAYHTLYGCYYDEMTNRYIFLSSYTRNHGVAYYYPESDTLTEYAISFPVSENDIHVSMKIAGDVYVRGTVTNTPTIYKMVFSTPPSYETEESIDPAIVTFMKSTHDSFNSKQGETTIPGVYVSIPGYMFLDTRTKPFTVQKTRYYYPSFNIVEKDGEFGSFVIKVGAKYGSMGLYYFQGLYETAPLHGQNTNTWVIGRPASTIGQLAYAPIGRTYHNPNSATGVIDPVTREEYYYFAGLAGSSVNIYKVRFTGISNAPMLDGAVLRVQ